MKQKFTLFDLFNTVFILLIILAVAIPMWYILVISTSTYRTYLDDPVHLIPRSFTLQEYQRAFLKSRDMMISFFATIRITVLGTLISMIFNVLGGYAMSKNTLPGHKIIFKFMIFTMFFSGGLAPTYLLIKNLHMLNTIWSLTLPMSISTYNLILMKNFFAGMNPSIEEAAKIDGYNDVQILIRIILPLSKPAIAAISLFYAVGYWNDYFRALIYVSSKNLVPFQLFLRDLVIVNVAAAKIGVNMGPSAYEQFKMAVIIIGMLPVVIAYPFVQKYFTKGIILGSTKE